MQPVRLADSELVLPVSITFISSPLKPLHLFSVYVSISTYTVKQDRLLFTVNRQRKVKATPHLFLLLSHFLFPSIPDSFYCFYLLSVQPLFSLISSFSMRWFRSYGIIQNIMKKYYAKSCDLLHKVDGPRPLSLIQVSLYRLLFCRGFCDHIGTERALIFFLPLFYDLFLLFSL